MHGPVIAREVKNKTVELLARNERAMFSADSTINALEYDGIEAQIRVKEASATYQSTAFAGYDSAGVGTSVIIDVRGQFTDEIAEDMALLNVNNFGMAMDCYLATDVHSRFSKDFFNKQRTLPGETLSSGNRVQEHTGTIDYRFKPSLFNRARKTALSTAVSAGAPPTTANIAAAADPDSQFVNGADSPDGTYSYIVSLVFNDGETVASTQESVAVVAGDCVTTEITFTGAPLYANIFRAPVGTTVGHEWIGRVALGVSGAAVRIDCNAKLPGSNQAFLLMNDSDALTWKQLGSMIKYDLAVTDTSYKWLQLLYGTPLVSAARKHTIAENITS